MIVEIDDDYMDVVMLAWFKKQRQFVKEILEKNEYWQDQDRLDDEEWLHGLNIMIKNYDIFPAD